MSNIINFNIGIIENTQKAVGFIKELEPTKTITITITGDKQIVEKIQNSVMSIISESNP